ncbi:hypothetical protein [Acinetobacter johnsonii]|uniref:hypothetical protein n=1 Tax=Acinetobacter johnsonii TaxID=40214 RepID=UPI0022E2FC2A|nr:hypothetical protein [Acinetobacter johnsonii]
METKPIFEKKLQYMLDDCEAGPVSVSSERISLVSGVVCCGARWLLKPNSSKIISKPP